MPFACSICGEESTRICARCTKDACVNHICEKCRECSDCCECEVPLADQDDPATPTVHAVLHPDPEPQPEPPPPPPDPDPFPEEDPEPGIGTLAHVPEGERE